MTRKCLPGSLLIAALLAAAAPARRLVAEPAAPATTPWWHRFPVYCGDDTSAIDDKARLEALCPRMVQGNYYADPVWGPLGQLRNGFLRDRFKRAHEAGLHWITWVETFGQVCMHVCEVEKGPDGAFMKDPGLPGLPRINRAAWGWEDIKPSPKGEYRWVGPHNAINDEDFVMPALAREKLGFPKPMYPDGRPAIGWDKDRQYPLSARLFDACCSKNVNGRIDNEIDPLGDAQFKAAAAKGIPADALVRGLYKVVHDAGSVLERPDHKPGDVEYTKHLSLGKDPACPFWTDYIRVSVREILRQGLDGLWCDNYSPWDNFLRFNAAFGDWSESRFRDFLTAQVPASQRTALGIADPKAFSIRDYLKQKAAALGAKNPGNPRERAWSDPRWLDEPVWCAYKVFKRQVGREGLQAFYKAVKEEAAKAGRPDFLVSGNDIPKISLGWVQDDWLDMVSTEQSPGWCMAGGSRGIGLPPVGKMAVTYRAALEFQKGPYSACWYYMPEKQRGKTALAKVLQAEAFANHAFLKFGDAHLVGTPTSLTWWNGFVTSNEPRLSPRVPVADVGVLFSPDNQLADLTPGGWPRFDAQRHVFGHWGFATALVDAHVPYRVVTDWKLTRPGALDGLRILVIPDADALDDDALPVLEAWVKGGGRLVLTGPAGIRHGVKGLFRRRERSLFAGLLGPEIDAVAATIGPGEAAGVVQVGVDPTKAAVQDQKTDPAAAAGPLGPMVERVRGKGVVAWTAGPGGMAYYLRDKERAALRPGVLKLAGESAWAVGGNLPATVGTFLWSSPDCGTLFVDLVNYDVDADADAIRPVKGLRFEIALPGGVSGAEIETLSPDAGTTATVAVRDSRAVVEVSELAAYACVKLAWRRAGGKR